MDDLGGTPKSAGETPTLPGSAPGRFILVEIDPKIARDITSERVRRVANGYTNARGDNVPGLGGGFSCVTHEGRAVYLLFNGILGDRKVDGGNVLTGPILASLPSHQGPKVIYAAACRLGRARLTAEQISFKQTPYDLQV